MKTTAAPRNHVAIAYNAEQYRTGDARRAYTPDTRR